MSFGEYTARYIQEETLEINLKKIEFQKKIEKYFFKQKKKIKQKIILIYEISLDFLKIGIWKHIKNQKKISKKGSIKSLWL